MGKISENLLSVKSPFQVPRSFLVSIQFINQKKLLRLSLKGISFDDSLVDYLCNMTELERITSGEVDIYHYRLRSGLSLVYQAQNLHALFLHLCFKAGVL